MFTRVTKTDHARSDQRRLYSRLGQGRESLGQETLRFNRDLASQRGLHRTQSRPQERNSSTRNDLEKFTRLGVGCIPMHRIPFEKYGHAVFDVLVSALYNE